MSKPSIEQSPELLKAILDTVVDGIITINERGIIQSLNPAAENIFGYRSDELIGENVSKLMPSPYREEHDGYIANYHRTSDAKIIGIGREVEGRRKDGSVFPLYLAVSGFESEGKKYYTGILRDITDLKNYQDHLEDLVQERTQQVEDAQAQLLRQERLAVLGQLAGSVAHEIRNPLGAIKNNIYFLNMVAEDLADDAQTAISDIERELATTNRIVSELLDYARQPQVNREQVKVTDILTAAVRNLQLPEGVTLRHGNSDDAITATIDAPQIERVLANLILNALQAVAADNGAVEVNWIADGGQVRITVTDDGPGIDPGNLDRIFEPLFTTKAKGIGLGLPLSKRYAELNDGELQVESSPGNGTTFTLVIPR